MPLPLRVLGMPEGGKGGRLLSLFIIALAATPTGCPSLFLSIWAMSVLSGVAGNDRLVEDAVLLGVCGDSPLPCVPFPLPTAPKLARSNAARVGVTPSSCSGILNASPCPLYPLYEKLFALLMASYELDPELALVRRLAAGADIVE